MEYLNVESIDSPREKRPGATVGHVGSEVRTILLLDRSSSMKGNEEQVINGLREFFAHLQSSFPSSHLLLTLVEFGNQPETRALLQPLDRVPIDYRAADESTALWDAIIHALRQEKARYEPPIVCVIASDGEDTCSANPKQKQREARAMIQVRQSWGNWLFYVLNLQSRPSDAARSLLIESIDCSVEKINDGFSRIARRMARDVKTLRNAKQSASLLRGADHVR
jgi:hypothetical protein